MSSTLEKLLRTFLPQRMSFMISFTPFFSLYQPLILPIYVHSDGFDTPEPVDDFCIFFSDLTIFPLEITAEFCYFNAVDLRPQPSYSDAV